MISFSDTGMLIVLKHPYARPLSLPATYPARERRQFSQQCIACPRLNDLGGFVGLCFVVVIWFRVWGVGCGDLGIRSCLRHRHRQSERERERERETQTHTHTDTGDHYLPGMLSCNISATSACLPCPSPPPSPSQSHSSPPPSATSACAAVQCLLNKSDSTDLDSPPLQQFGTSNAAC